MSSLEVEVLTLSLLGFEIVITSSTVVFKMISCEFALASFSTESSAWKTLQLNLWRTNFNFFNLDLKNSIQRRSHISLLLHRLVMNLLYKGLYYFNFFDCELRNSIYEGLCYNNFFNLHIINSILKIVWYFSML